ncbi:MAG: TetR/AcrR family transcriptional regulator [Alphaproteobacteria bacterium]
MHEKTRPPAGGSEAGAEKDTYHHGNLREALLAAATAIIDEKGLDGLSLRACAARAGVSHAAPAHHFANLRGLLTALGTIAFRRFHARIAAEQARAGGTAIERLRAAAHGYVGFAVSNPGLFRLMFSASLLDWEDAELGAAAGAA